MKIMQNELATKFLLGKLSEEEQTRIEADYFENNALFEEIQIAENDLIDDYVAGNLSAEDKKRFENRLLLNPKQRQRVEFARTLSQYASNQPLAVKEVNTVSLKSKWSTFVSDFFSVKPMLSFSFAAAALICLGIGVWFSLSNLNNQNQADQTTELARTEIPAEVQSKENRTETVAEMNTNSEAAVENKTVSLPSSKEANQQIQNKTKSLLNKPTNEEQAKDQEPKKTSAPVIFSFALSAGVTRAEGSTKDFLIPEKASLVNIQLKFDETEYASYSAVLETVEGQQIWNKKLIKPGKNKNENAVNVSLPSHLLKKGDYIMTLKGITKEGMIENINDYSFTVDRR